MRDIKLELVVLKVNDDHTIFVLTQREQGRDILPFTQLNDDESFQDALVRLFESVGLNNDKGHAESLGVSGEANQDLVFNYAAILNEKDEYEAIFPLDFRSLDDVDFQHDSSKQLVGSLIKHITK